MFARLPMKGPIFAYGAVALALAGVGQLARSRADQVRSLLGVAPGGAAGSATLEATTLNRATLEALALTEETSGAAPEVTGATQAEVETARHEPRLHAPFMADTPDAVRPSPRNVIVRLSDAAGAPLVAASVAVQLSGDDGRATPNAYLFTDDPTRWTIGCAALTPGQRARFHLRAETAAGAWEASVDLAEIPADGDIDLGVVRCAEAP